VSIRFFIISQVTPPIKEPLNSISMVNFIKTFSQESDHT